MNRKTAGLLRIGLAVLCMAVVAAPAFARLPENDPEWQDILQLQAEYGVGPLAAQGGRVARPNAIPDIFGPGAVLTVGNVFMKCTNYGFDGNPFTNVSSDPSGQWPGASAVEYLNLLGIGVGGVNPFATDPLAVRRVSLTTEWRPATLDPEDRMYRSYDGIVNGTRFINDDGDNDPTTGDGLYDEDFLDGRDNDGDGKIDEDFAAIGQQMYTCVMRDDTQQAIQAAAAERHVPLGLECRKSDWAYSIPGFTDFNVIQYDVFNRSGHTIDSLMIAFRTDMDCGPIEKSNYFSDDFNLPQFPQGDFVVETKSTDLRLQPASDRPQVNDAPRDSSLCTHYKIRVQGWSITDDDGDEDKTPGIGTIMLIDHTIDPTGVNGPMRVQLHSFRSFVGGTPYQQGGNPTIDQQRFELMASGENVDRETGFITQVPGDQKGDYTEWAVIGPWRNVADGAKISATLAFGVKPGKRTSAMSYMNDFARFARDSVISRNSTELKYRFVYDATTLMDKYPTLENAIAAQIAFEGAYESKAWPMLPDAPGRETGLKAPLGQFYYTNGCEARDPAPRLVTDRQYEWFDFDCDYCTGAFSSSRGGLFHRTWLAEAPPPSPNTNMAVSYNYSDNPERLFVPAGDGQVTVAWDNLSETTPDPKTGQFDFRGYRIWKVSNWQRPVGSGGPNEDDWTLLAEYRLFDQHATNGFVCTVDSASVWQCTPGDTIGPWVYIPNKGARQRVLLHRGDLWNRQTGDVITPDPAVLCKGWPDCLHDDGFPLGQTSGGRVSHDRYPIGRYRYVDREVKNGFVYFYAVTAFDSTGSADQISILSSRRSAVEAEGVVPQVVSAAVGNADRVWVVPNPYRGVRAIDDRPSSWDLTPNASDPTGTHIDFFGLPRGAYKIKIFTVSGDEVATINSTDGVNESVRGPMTDGNGVIHPGYNRQQDNENDGQARWNLISRNGQDVVSGIYLFTVEVGGTVKNRGKFVIIR
ncbi:MAG: hypothetical protein HZA61_17030 [Candidatus Eisenbacteria bacterium]|uniref:T9SS type A sorting domain-containing protein n=1 Tax=Eiseniibacteriota bacterium TaxID=2212470 RepID=A0A933W4M3_UNCEI|nr:hypothetical protein [Candidatus Eisenbacteria bacterium]